MNVNPVMANLKLSNQEEEIKVDATLFKQIIGLSDISIITGLTSVLELD